MKYEVNRNSSVLFNNVRYPGGSILPSSLAGQIPSLIEAGVISEVPEAPSSRPKPVREGRAFSHAGYDPKKPESVSNVPLRLMPSLLASVSVTEELLALHEADTRKGGKDLIEERLGELEASND